MSRALRVLLAVFIALLVGAFTLVTLTPAGPARPPSAPSAGGSESPTTRPESVTFAPTDSWGRAPSNYDTPGNPARASAGLDGSRVAPNTNVGGLQRLRNRVGNLSDETGALGGGASRLTNSQAADMANWVGFRPAGKWRIKGQQVFTDGRRYIVQDVDSHLPDGL